MDHCTRRDNAKFFAKDLIQTGNFANKRIMRWILIQYWHFNSHPKENHRVTIELQNVIFIRQTGKDTNLRNKPVEKQIFFYQR